MTNDRPRSGTQTRHRYTSCVHNLELEEETASLNLLERLKAALTDNCNHFIYMEHVSARIVPSTFAALQTRGTSFSRRRHP